MLTAAWACGGGDGGSTQPPPPVAPVADFDVDCVGPDCTFTDKSTDANGNNTITTRTWDFGDTQTGTGTPVAHSYPATTDLTNYTVALTVTDDGGLTGTKSQEITISPPATLTCGTTPDCSLILDRAARVTVTLTSASCLFHGNTLTITAPVQETLFTDGCYTAPGTSYQLQGGAVISAGTEIKAQITTDPANVLELPPAVKVTGDFNTGWTLSFDDGGESTPPEPDFNDLIITVVATP